MTYTVPAEAVKRDECWSYNSVNYSTHLTQALVGNAEKIPLLYDEGTSPFNEAYQE
jgi:hypothetical protein